MANQFAGRFYDAFLDRNSKLIKSTPYSVFTDSAATTLATRYTDRTKSTQTTAQLQTSSAGMAEFFVDPGVYYIKVGTADPWKVIVYEDQEDTVAPSDLPGLFLDQPQRSVLMVGTLGARPDPSSELLGYRYKVTNLATPTTYYCDGTQWVVDSTVGGGSESGGSSEVTQIGSYEFGNTVFPSELATIEFAADQLLVGDVVTLTAFGTLENATGNPRGFSPSLVFDGVTVESDRDGSFESSLTPYPWSLDLRLLVLEGSQTIEMTFTVDTADGSQKWVALENFTADISDELSLAVKGTFSAAVSSLKITTAGGYWYVVNGPIPGGAQDPLFFTDYDSVGPSGSATLTPIWQSEQQPNNPGSTGPAANRITIIDASSVPGSGPYKPIGNAMRVELRPFSATNPGTGSPADGDVQGGQYNRAEVYARNGGAENPASTWPDPPGSERWYGWSVYIPSDFVPATDTRWFTLTQWKGQQGGSPPVALELKRTNFRLGGDRTNHALVPNDGTLMAFTPGNWYKIVVGIKYEMSATEGWVNVWMNDVERIGRMALSTLDQIPADSGNPDQMYLKQGIYRSTAWAVDHVLYFSPLVIATRKVDVESKLNTVLAGS